MGHWCQKVDPWHKETGAQDDGQSWCSKEKMAIMTTALALDDGWHRQERARPQKIEAKRWAPTSAVEPRAEIGGEQASNCKMMRVFRCIHRFGFLFVWSNPMGSESISSWRFAFLKTNVNPIYSFFLSFFLFIHFIHFIHLSISSISSLQFHPIKKLLMDCLFVDLLLMSYMLIHTYLFILGYGQSPKWVYRRLTRCSPVLCQSRMRFFRHRRPRRGLCFGSPIPPSPWWGSSSEASALPPSLSGSPSGSPPPPPLPFVATAIPRACSPAGARCSSSSTLHLVVPFFPFCLCSSISPFFFSLGSDSDVGFDSILASL